ncbi:hypothetical protein FOMPIDRAFT_1108436, partial [Fomitopsis schrenkii]
VGASSALMLYEHSLNLDEEISLFWKGKRWSLLPTTVLVDIYVREIGMLFMALTNNHGIHSCSSFVNFVMFYGVLTTASIHSTILYRVYTLWDKQRLVAYTLILGFFICFGGTVILAVLTGIHLSGMFFQYSCCPSLTSLLGGLVYIEEANTCSFQQRTLFSIGVWAPMVLFDFCVLIILFLRSLGNPRRQDSQLAALLYRDGFIMFLV